MIERNEPMSAISASLVKELRERTGLGMMECKKALVEANGDIEKAIDDLRKSSGLKAAKKAGRTAAEGVVAIKVADDNSYGVLVEINSETDFVARDDNFLSFVSSVVEKAFTDRQTDAAALANDVEEVRQALVQKIGENISVRRVILQEAPVVGSYVHNNNRIGVLVSIAGGNAELAKDIAMHVAAVNPQVVNPEDMPEELLAKEREIFFCTSQRERQARRNYREDDRRSDQQVPCRVQPGCSALCQGSRCESWQIVEGCRC
jgi:elongation factor Ts